MAIFDVLNCFTYNQTTGAIAQAFTADAAFQQTIDLDAAGIRVGHGNLTHWLIVLCTIAFNNATSINLRLENDADSAFGSVNLIDQKNILTASMAANTFVWQQPLPAITYERYMRMYLDRIGGTDPTTGTLIAWLNPHGPVAEVSPISLVAAS